MRLTLGWKPFRLLNCWVSQPLFMEKLEGIWKKCGIKFDGRIQLVKKLAFMATKLRIWNIKEFGNQDSKLLQRRIGSLAMMNFLSCKH